MLEDGHCIPNSSPLEVRIKDQDHQSATAFLIINIDLQIENNKRERELIIN